jgi:hypothetical protein
MTIWVGVAIGSQRDRGRRDDRHAQMAAPWNHDHWLQQWSYRRVGETNDRNARHILMEIASSMRLDRLVRWI